DPVPPHEVVDAERDERQQRHRPRAPELDAIPVAPDQQFLSHVNPPAWLSARLYAEAVAIARRRRRQPASAATIRGNTSRGASRPKNTSMCEKPGSTCRVSTPGRRAFSQACVRRWPDGRKQRFSAPAISVKRVSAGGAAARKSSGRPRTDSSTATRDPCFAHAPIWRKNEVGTHPNSRLIHACVASERFSWRHRTSGPRSEERRVGKESRSRW